MTYRPPEVLRATHPVPTRQHRWSSGSGRELGATLAPTGGQDRTAGSGPHPVAEAVGPAPAPVARLKGALAHGTTPTIVEIWTVNGCSPGRPSPGGTPTNRLALPCGRRPSNGTGRDQVGQTGDAGRIVQSNHPTRPVDTPHDQRIFADGLHDGPTVASVALLETFTSEGRVGPARSAQSIHRVRRSPPALADRRTFCAHLWITVWSTSTNSSTDARQPTAGVSRAESGPSRDRSAGTDIHSGD
jgi:hypothetical protein